MSVINVETKAGQMWDRLYHSRPDLPEELQLLFANLQQYLGDTKEVAQSLPAQLSAEMGRYLQLCMQLLSKLDLVATEKQVAGALVEKFGPPQFSQAVPTFNLLTGFLLDAESIAELTAKELGTLINEIKSLLYRANILVHESRVEKLKSKLHQEEAAISQFSDEAIRDNRPGIRHAIAIARKKFERTARFYRVEIQKLRSEQLEWQQLMGKLVNNTSKTQGIIQKKYEINPSLTVS